MSTINEFSPLDKINILNQLSADATSYYLRGEVTGMMFYGNDHFLNYFECSKKNLWQNKQDTIDYPHHHDVQLIYENAISEKKINHWQMSHTPSEPRVQAFLSKQGWTTFNPYLLKGELLYVFMSIIMSYAENEKVHAIQPTKVATNTKLKSYVFGSIIVVCAAWLIFMALGYFDYLPFTPFEIN